MVQETDSRAEYHIIFYDNSDSNHDLLPQTKIALFAKKVDPMPGNIDARIYQAYLNPYLILSGMIIKDVLAKKNIKVLINSFYNYLKPTRYDMLVLDKTKLIHTFSSVEEFFYDILYPDDKGKTRPLERTPLRDPSFLGGTMSNTQFIRENPVQADAGLADRMKTNLDVGFQIFHFEKVYTIFDRLNNIVIPEDKAITAVKEDPEMKKHIIKVDLKKYSVASLDEVAFQKSKIYSLRGHYLIGRTFYNNTDIESATYLIVEKPHVINTLELCTNTKWINMMVKNFIDTSPMTDDREIINLVYPQVQGKHIQNFLGLSPTLRIPFLNKDYILVDKECLKEDTAAAMLVPPRKFVANMYEAKYFLDIIQKD
ncbi:MAG TPA: hypothetical protein PLY66_09140 [Acidobacteriota bacterium]|nr:hypothetical protein [Acidobacteriota bacterium]HOT01156.1 hypothetical protein [Acidobacteriota bacterium]HQF86957.1 hypothetical protein [Acidobacteriota bacterium]HQG91245.1 hypothetical protein [Acidobacteriota bacterium]HQK86294.1 hypothetical protein [Acidobacteriota bacterium]